MHPFVSFTFWDTGMRTCKHAGQALITTRVWCAVLSCAGKVLRVVFVLSQVRLSRSVNALGLSGAMMFLLPTLYVYIMVLLYCARHKLFVFVCLPHGRILSKHTLYFVGCVVVL